MPENLVRRFVDLIKGSLEEIEEIYFNLPRASGQQQELPDVVRERVFCYEFYHQTRLSMEQTPNHSDAESMPLIYLHGEPDKKGHIDFENENPDFIIHIPGQTRQNILIIEVKGIIERQRHCPATNTEENEAFCDIEKILKFINRPHNKYEAGIFVVFNYSLDELRNVLAINSQP